LTLPASRPRRGRRESAAALLRRRQAPGATVEWCGANMGWPRAVCFLPCRSRGAVGGFIQPLHPTRVPMVQAVAGPCREAAARAQPRGAAVEARAREVAASDLAREVAAADLVRAAAVAAPQAPPVGPRQQDSHAAAPRAMRGTPAWRFAGFPSARLAGSPANLAAPPCPRAQIRWTAAASAARFSTA
jgi:hypothetical protein